MANHSESYTGRVFMVDARHNVLGDGPHEVWIEDWWDDLTGGSWMWADGNLACLIYAIRAGIKRLPVDDEVLYGKIRPSHLGILVHVSELGEEVT